MPRPGEQWFDDAAGPLVRPYARTGGRTMGAAHDLDMLTVVHAPYGAPPLRRVEPEYAEIVRLCQLPQSVAEVSATLRLPLAVTKILVGDLISDRLLNFRAPATSDAGPGDLNVLRAVLDGIRKL
ncbi:DUF742 domain-containing protein [Nocardia otitidiscaviarum]|uniref:DUF742 domain-containing protein n=2 Tax=Nocardia otitidiscaviarum TaxID=1823 RepID=A0A516NX30_9NOCA|nr:MULTISPECIES: DUF742 domain-containing protein [Nocardia]MBF6136385.1 DUF742 domain-containing protein [Nocardia otitidiscaviarum]MBF6180620.1 DUF742 domain-containing protein [Nocardia otitidiscaviarum]MBF6484587.1 DUF742 domain-containing protein [Nocardia otitidiscaviarum]MCP9619034.1 DUF742 domain-containing protein [Nocardia otitidiscaviarum]QDP83453.1 DUF742 domain-containing protein [Nocardia otitidiscaviarum]